MQSLRTCFLSGEYPPMQGGVADHTAHLAHHLIEGGIEVSVLTSSKARIGHQPPALGSRAPSELQVYPIISGWGPGCWGQVGGWVREHCPDILHIQYQAAAYNLGGWVNWLPWWLRRRSRHPRVVVTFHDLRVPYLFPKAGSLRWRSILALARNVDAVIVTNIEDEQTLRKSLARQTSDVRQGDTRRDRSADWLLRIPLGSNVDVQPPAGYDRDRWRARMGINEDTFVLAYFGFLNESKGGEELILSLGNLVLKGFDSHLMMVGGQLGDVDPTNQAYADRVRSLIQMHGLVERVHWTGYTPPAEVSANLLAADLVVMPYRDGASFRRTTLIAALRHGRPVVTTHPTIPLEELCDGDNVLLVPPRDVGALTKAVVRVFEDRDLRARLSAGAEALGRQFDWLVITRQTLDLYRGLKLE